MRISFVRAVLAFMTFPKEHRAKIHSTDPLERLNGEIKRRTEVVGTFFLQRHLISRRTLCSFRAQAIAD